MKKHKTKKGKEKLVNQKSEETWADHLNSGKVLKQIAKERFSLEHQCISTSPRYNDDKSLTPRPRKRNVACQIINSQERAQEPGAQGDYNSEFKKEKPLKSLKDLIQECVKIDGANFTTSQHSVPCCYGFIQPAACSCPVYSQPQPVLGVINHHHNFANYESSLCQEEYYFDWPNCPNKSLCCGNCKSATFGHGFRRRKTDLDTQHFFSVPKGRSCSPVLLKADKKLRRASKETKESLEEFLEKQRRVQEKLKETLQKQMKEFEKYKLKEIKEKSLLKGENFCKFLSKSEASELVEVLDRFIDEREKEPMQQNKIKKQNFKDKISTAAVEEKDERQVSKKREQEKVTYYYKQLPNNESLASHYSHKTMEILKKMKILEYIPHKPNFELDKSNANKQQQEKIKNYQQYLIKFSKEEKVVNPMEVLKQPSYYHRKAEGDDLDQSKKPGETEETKEAFFPQQTFQNINLKTNEEQTNFFMPENRQREFSSNKEEDRATISQKTERIQKLKSANSEARTEKQNHWDYKNFAEQQYELKKLKDLNNETKQDMENQNYRMEDRRGMESMNLRHSKDFQEDDEIKKSTKEKQQKHDFEKRKRLEKENFNLQQDTYGDKLFESEELQREVIENKHGSEKSFILKPATLKEAKEQDQYSIESEKESSSRREQNRNDLRKPLNDQQTDEGFHQVKNTNSRISKERRLTEVRDHVHGQNMRKQHHSPKENKPVESPITIECLKGRRLSSWDQNSLKEIKKAQYFISESLSERNRNEAYKPAPYLEEIQKERLCCRAHNEAKLVHQSPKQLKQCQYSIERMKESHHNQKIPKEFEQGQISTSRSSRERRFNESEQYNNQKKPISDMNGLKQLKMFQNTEMNNSKESRFYELNEEPGEPKYSKKSKAEKDKEELIPSQVKSDDSVKNIKMERKLTRLSAIYRLVGDPTSKAIQDHECKYLEEEKEASFNPELKSEQTDANVGRTKASNQIMNRCSHENSPRKFQINKEEQRFCKDGIEKGNLEKEAIFASSSSSRPKSSALKDHKSSTKYFEFEEVEKRFYNDCIVKDCSELLWESKKEALLGSPVSSRQKPSTIVGPKEKLLIGTENRRDPRTSPTELKADKEEQRFYLDGIENEDFELLQNLKEDLLESSQSYSAQKPSAIESPNEQTLSVEKERYDQKRSTKENKTESESEKEILYYWDIDREDLDQDLDPDLSHSQRQPSPIERPKESRLRSDQSQNEYERCLKDFITEKEEERSLFFGLQNDDPKLLWGFKEEALDLPQFSSRQTHSTESSRKGRLREAEDPNGNDRSLRKAKEKATDQRHIPQSSRRLIPSTESSREGRFSEANDLNDNERDLEKAREKPEDFKQKIDVYSSENLTSLEVHKQVEVGKEKLPAQTSIEDKSTDALKPANKSFLKENVAKTNYEILKPSVSLTYDDFKAKINQNREIFTGRSSFIENNYQNELKSKVSNENFTKEKEFEDETLPLSYQAEDVLRNLKKFLKSFSTISLEENTCLHSVTKAAEDLVNKLSSCKSLIENQSSVEGKDLLGQIVNSKDIINKSFEEQIEREAVFKDLETSPESSDSQLKGIIKVEEKCTTNLGQKTENELQFLEKKTSSPSNEGSQSEAKTFKLIEDLETEAVNKELPTNEYFEQETYQLQTCLGTKQWQASETYERYEESKVNLGSSTCRTEFANGFNIKKEPCESESSKVSSTTGRQSIFASDLMPLKGILKPCRLLESPQADTYNLATYETSSVVSESEKDLINIQQGTAITFNLGQEREVQQINNEGWETLETNKNSQHPIAVQTKKIQHQQPVYPEAELENCFKNNNHTRFSCVQMPAFDQCPCMWETYVEMMNNYYKGKSKY